MAHIASSISIDSVASTGSATLFVDGALVTTYAYGNGTVTLSARPSKDSITLSEFKENVSLLREWVNLIKRFIHPSGQPYPEINEEMKFRPGKIEATFTLQGQGKIQDSESTLPSEITEFKARPEKTMTFRCFDIWVSFMERLIDRIRFAVV